MNASCYLTAKLISISLWLIINVSTLCIISCLAMIYDIITYSWPDSFHISRWIKITSVLSLTILVCISNVVGIIEISYQWNLTPSIEQNLCHTKQHDIGVYAIIQIIWNFMSLAFLYLVVYHSWE